jgi:hypothetical protein
MSNVSSIGAVVRLLRRMGVTVKSGVVLALLLGVTSSLHAQRGRGATPPASPRAGAPVDLTGLWVSIVTEDWRVRMVTPPKGERPGIPLNAEGVRVSNAWDPAKDETAGEQCRAYGAPGVMRAAGRIRISWADDSTLKVDAEAGTQTRLLTFGSPGAPSRTPGWQGDSAAQWEISGGGRRGRSGAPPSGDLKVVTRNMRPGYSQKNGVPYGSGAVLTEYFNRLNEPDGTSYLVLTAILEDPQYYNTPFIRSSHFRKLPDNGPWEPEQCTSR